MPRVVRIHEIGGPEVLRIENIDVRAPEKGEVQIQVKALGLNRAEAMFRSGHYLEAPKFPSRLGYEAAGIVKSVGQDVKNFSPGDIVSVIPPTGFDKYGVYGEVAVVPAQNVVKHPSSLSFIEASAIWMQYLTAYGALIDVAKLTKGDYVVIPAASSSVGLAAIQLANIVGAIPIATTRTSKKKKALEEVGVRHVIVTQDEDVTKRLQEITQNEGARVVFDPVGGKGVQALAEGMSFGGIMIEYGALSPEPTPFPLFTALLKCLTMRGYVLFEVINDSERVACAVKFIVNAIEAKTLKPIIDKIFTLDEIVDAHRYLESNQQFGKIVVTV